MLQRLSRWKFPTLFQNAASHHFFKTNSQDSFNLSETDGPDSLSLLSKLRLEFGSMTTQQWPDVDRLTATEIEFCTRGRGG
jgi:hypothetical protein